MSMFPYVSKTHYNRVAARRRYDDPLFVWWTTQANTLTKTLIIEDNRAFKKIQKSGGIMIFDVAWMDTASLEEVTHMPS